METQVAGESVCVVGSGGRGRVEVCHGSVGVGGVAGEGVSRSGGRSGWRVRVSERGF